MLDKALQNDAFKTATSTDGTTKYDKLAADFWNTEKNVDALVAFLNTDEAYKLALRGETEIAKQRAAITIQKMINVTIVLMLPTIAMTKQLQ